MELLERFVRSAFELADRSPVLALALGGALAAVFIAIALGRHDDDDKTQPFAALLFRKFTRIVWALTLVAFLAGTVMVLRSYLNRTLAEFRHSHGRVTEVNLSAVRTIWGDEQVQDELNVTLTYDEEEIERLESEDPTKPTVTRKKKVQHTVTDNPFVGARHEVTLRQNPRKKGSAVYAGYETDARYTYKLKNPSDREVKTALRFPLPSERSMFTDLAVKLNGQSGMDRLRVSDGDLLLEQNLSAGEAFEFEVAFKSRGLAYWYFQVREPREIRDFQLTLRLPDLPKDKLNYPEGCMTPTEITSEGDGSVLTYKLDRALSSKGMGVEMPKQKQPGETTDAVLAQTEKAWVLLFATVLLGLTLSGGMGERGSGGMGTAKAGLVAVLVGAATAFGYGFVANLSDLFLGFSGSFVLFSLLLFAVGWLVMRRVNGLAGNLLCLALPLFGAALPLAAGLDGERQSLYLNIAAFLLLLFAAWQLLKHFSLEKV